MGTKHTFIYKMALFFMMMFLFSLGSCASIRGIPPVTNGRALYDITLIDPGVQSYLPDFRQQYGISSRFPLQSGIYSGTNRETSNGYGQFSGYGQPNGYSQPNGYLLSNQQSTGQLYDPSGFALIRPYRYPNEGYSGNYPSGSPTSGYQQPSPGISGNSYGSALPGGYSRDVPSLPGNYFSDLSSNAGLPSISSGGYGVPNSMYGNRQPGNSLYGQ